MKKKFKNIMLGLIDGFLPTVKNSIDSETREVNKVRLFSCVLGWVAFVGICKGWLSIDLAIQFVNALINE